MLCLHKTLSANIPRAVPLQPVTCQDTTCRSVPKDAVPEHAVLKRAGSKPRRLETCHSVPNRAWPNCAVPNHTVPNRAVPNHVVQVQKSWEWLGLVWKMWPRPNQFGLSRLAYRPPPALIHKKSNTNVPCHAVWNPKLAMPCRIQNAVYRAEPKTCQTKPWRTVPTPKHAKPKRAIPCRTKVRQINTCRTMPNQNVPNQNVPSCSVPTCPCRAMQSHSDIYIH